MASEKITAMPNLAGGQVPTDLIPAVDLSALPASQNVKTTLNDLFSTVTKNITDRAVRFQAAGSTPGLSTPTTGALYFDGSTFQASQNGGAWTAVVLAGSITTCGLTQKTARMLGRTTAGNGAIEEISIGSGLLLAGGSLSASGLALAGLITASGLTQNTARILGRTTAGTGAIEEISIGSGLALAAGSLAASGLLTASGYTQNTARLIGRSTAGVGAVEEISIGANLSLVGGVLSATGGGGTPGGSTNDVQYHASGGTFGGSNNFQFKITGAPTVGILATSASHQVLTVRGDAAQTAEIVRVVQGGDNAAALLTLQQGVLSSLTSNFPFRYESAGGTLILGLRARPATGIYQFVSPGANTGTVAYEVGTLGSNNGLGLATGSQSPSMFAGNIQCVWWSGYTGNTVINQAYQLAFGSAPGTVRAGIASPFTGVVSVTDGSTGRGQLLIGTSSDPIIGALSAIYPTTNTLASITVAHFSLVSSGVPTAGFGPNIILQGSSSAFLRFMGQIETTWITATDATRQSQMRFSVVDLGAVTPRLTLTPTTVQVPTGQFIAPSINQGIGQLQGLFFWNGSTYGGMMQSNAFGGPPITNNSVFFGVNRSFLGGAVGSTGMDGSLPGNLLIFTNTNFQLTSYPGGSNSGTIYMDVDGANTTRLNAQTSLSIWSFLGALARVRYGAAGSAVDDAGVAGRVLMI